MLETLLDRQVDSSTASDFNASAAGAFPDLVLQVQLPEDPLQEYQFCRMYRSQEIG